jgi:hypothetical protein
LFLVASKTTDFGTHPLNSSSPHTIGNVVRGVSLVAALGHTQGVGGGKS